MNTNEFNEEYKNDYEEYYSDNEETEQEVSDMKDKNNRLFVYVHATEEMQNDFLKEAMENGCFAQSVNFMVRQGAVNIFRKKVYNQGKEIDVEERNKLWNGIRPYMSISNGNPDKIGNYYNWTYLECAIETGWKSQFSGHDHF